ncbi:MAG: hypothetical protein HY746_07520 [Elusimicrobia bacterium]|nr:hypothetical protein [Elusimicrobiota bacterium]
MKRIFLVTGYWLLVTVVFSGCFGGLKRLRVVDFTDSRVTDLTLTKKVIGKRDYVFFSTTKTGVFLEGNIQGTVTDYKDNPIEGVTVRAAADSARSKGEFGGEEIAGIEESAKSFVELLFTPGITDSQGLFKIHFSLPVVDDEVDVKGKLVYNPGWEQQKVNIGKAYEPQMKESPFRLYYSLDTGFLAFAEGIRKVIVQPIGEGKGRLDVLPGSKAPESTAPAKSAPAVGQEEEDLFKAFNLE